MAFKPQGRTSRERFSNDRPARAEGRDRNEGGNFSRRDGNQEGRTRSRMTNSGPEPVYKWKADGRGPGKPEGGRPDRGGFKDKPAGGRSFDKKPFNREGGERSFDRKPFNREGGERSFDRKPFNREGGERSFDRKPFNREGGERSFDRKPFNREGGERSFDRKPFNREGGERSFDRKPFNREGGERSFDRKPFNREGGERSFDRKPFNREGGERSFDRKPFNREGGERSFDRKPFNREGGERSFDRKPFNREGGERSFDRKPFNREGGERSFDRKPFNREGGERSFDRKPFNREGGERSFDRKPFNREGGERSFDRKPFNREGGERSFDRKPFNRDDRSGGRREFNNRDERGFKPRTERSENLPWQPGTPALPERKRSANPSPRNNERPWTDRDVKEQVQRIRARKTTRDSFGTNVGTLREAPDYSSKLDVMEKKMAKKAGKPTGDLAPEAESTRLNKYIANAGVCSRRDADVLITSGKVLVNGAVVTELGHKVFRGDVVTYMGKELNPEKLVYILLNKPKDYITTTEDPEQRHTVMELVKSASTNRIFPVGRLDRNTTGLLLLTNDGALAEKMTHPSFETRKIYQVDLDKPISDEHYEQVKAGVELEDGVAVVDEVEVLSPDRDILGLAIHSGRNRIVRRIFEALGYEVIRLDRVMYAGLTKKDLPRGHWRYLAEQEVINLKYFLK